MRFELFWTKVRPSPVMRLCAYFFLLVGSARAEQCLVIADSLTKDDEEEFPSQFLTQPMDRQARSQIRTCRSPNACPRREAGGAFTGHADSVMRPAPRERARHG